jgi:hypothetical protein
MMYLRFTCRYKINFKFAYTHYAAIKVSFCTAVQEGDATMMPMAS